MANYNLIVNSKFRPFSFAEYLQPYQLYGQAYKAIEDEYANLATKANIWDEMANEQTDPYAYKMYKTYSNDLKEQADQLAREGLTPASRQNMLKMRQRYSSDIIPIEQAYQRRRELVDEQRKELSRDNTIRYERMANTMSLDDFINNPSIDYGRSYSGALLAQQVGKAAANFQKALTDRTRLKSLGLPYQYERMLQRGATPDQVLAAMTDQAEKGDPEAVKFLRGIVDQAIKSSGVEDWADPNTKEEFRYYANQGLYNAIGEAKPEYFTDSFTMREELSKSPIPERTNRGLNNDNSLIVSPRIIEGASGKVNKELKSLEGLRRTEKGYSTTKLDILQQKINKAEKELNSFSEEEIQSYKKYESKKAEQETKYDTYTSLGKAMSNNITNPAPSGYNKYSKAQLEYKEALGEFNTEVESLRALERKYSHLGNTPYEGLLIGTTLDNRQGKEELTSFPLGANSTDYNKVRDWVDNILGSVTKDSIESGSIGLIDNKGNSLGYKETQEILDNKDKIYLKVKGGKDPHLALTYDGEEFSIKGIEQINSYNKDLKVIQESLRDFSSNIVPSITEISHDDYINILNNGISNVRIEVPYRIVQIPGSNYRMTTLHDYESGDYIKVIMDIDGNIVASNSLRDELNGGQNRDSYFINMAQTGLNDLVNLATQ